MTYYPTWQEIPGKVLSWFCMWSQCGHASGEVNTPDGYRWTWRIRVDGVLVVRVSSVESLSCLYAHGALEKEFLRRQLLEEANV